MEPAQALYDLQALDLRMAADGAKLESERARIDEPPAVRQARAALASLETKIAGLEKELRATEQEVAAVTAKKQAVHAKLYGGSVTVPRELTALETEEAALQRSLSQLEDRELELMGAAEDAEQSQASARQRLDEEIARWRQQGSEAHQHIDQLDAEVRDLQAQRAELAAQISPANLALYERLRPRKGNRPVALVEKNMCQGCRVDLPSGDVQRARGADPPSTCENCGRLLYVR
ncbi:MAG TPA: C4-type zinc ribbon domain-containing protein [Chloroflexota bacterium]